MFLSSETLPLPLLIKPAALCLNNETSSQVEHFFALHIPAMCNLAKMVTVNRRVIVLQMHVPQTAKRPSEMQMQCRPKHAPASSAVSATHCMPDIPTTCKIMHRPQAPTE